MLICNILNHKKFTALTLVLVFTASWAYGQSALAQADELNFKVYSPDQPSSNDQTQPASKDSGLLNSDQNATPTVSGLSAEKAQSDVNSQVSNSSTENDAAIKNAVEIPANNAAPASKSTEVPGSDAASANKSSDVSTGDTAVQDNTTETATAAKENQSQETKSATSAPASGSPATGDNGNQSGDNKVLQGYVRIVPSGTKIPIVMDTAVDSDTSQEGDEFSARTVEDLTIDGTMVIPAGSIIRGRIATLNAPKHLNRSGSVALKFDTVTTPDNRQIPLVANLVARGGVVHARRGMKDIAIDSATFALPTLVALGIGAVAGHSSSSVGVGGGALIGAGVGAAVGLAILMAKKGKKVDVRPGDELKIELAEDLHMPAM
jgi:hypothetical protein